MKEVLIPIDFTRTSENALTYGYQLAESIDKKIKAIHVYMPSSIELSDSPLLNYDYQELRALQFDKFVLKQQNLLKKIGTKSKIIEKNMKVGFPGDEILKAIDEYNPELVIMGTTGDSSIIKK